MRRGFRFRVSGFRFQDRKKIVSVFGKKRRGTCVGSSLLSRADT